MILLCRAQRERNFLSRMMEQFLQVLDMIPAEGRTWQTVCVASKEGGR